ncbi:MAG: PAS domain S-box protein [Planctomycetales bacterium]|nr:PAS domain S-box protein [Planctomycetales bacterium]
MTRTSLLLSTSIALAIISLCVLSGLTYYNAARVHHTEEHMAHSIRVREAALELLSSIKDAEIGQRGFLITASDTDLQPYRTSVGHVDSNLDQMTQLLQDRPARAELMREITAQVEAKKAELATAVRLRQEIESVAGLAGTRAHVESGTGLEIMDAIHETLGELIAEETTLTNFYREDEEERASASKTMILLGNLLAISLLVVAAASAHFDRVKRDQAERKMAVSSTELQAILDSAADGVIAFGGDMGIRRMNPSAAAICQCDQERIVGNSILRFVPDEQRNAFLRLMEEFVHSNDQTRDHSGTALRSDGSEFPTEGTISKTSVDDQPFCTFTFRDLTEQRHGLAAIAQWNALLDQIHDAIHVCDMNDRVTFWNRGSEQMYGIPASDAIGRDICELLFEGMEEPWLHGKESVLAEGEYAAELRQIGDGGREIIVEHRRSLIRSRDGEPSGQLVMNIDITERKQEEARQRRSQRLESIGTLAGGIAHDFNNVLSPILMSGKLLQRGEVNLPKLASTIVSSAERGAQLVHKLLSFAGGEQGVHDRVALPGIVQETCDILRHTFSVDIDIVVHADDDLYCVRGNATELSQVLMNLAINARDAMLLEGGRLEIRAENVDLDENAGGELVPPGKYVKISVADTGCGIPGDIIDHIFDPFFTTKSQDKGTGLGLATTLGIVRSHGGEITVDSEPGRGTTFSIYLPTGVDETSTRSSVPPVIADGGLPAGHGETILLVDDEPLIVETARVVLESSGYIVRTANNGADAVALYHNAREQIALAVVDVMMPGMDGLETIRALRTIGGDIRLIASSGIRFPNSPILEDVSGLLPKPYSDEQLLTAVARALNTSPVKTN